MQQKLIESPNPWMSAMEEACIVNWCNFYEDDPVKTLHSIVAQDMAFALDPLISSDAQALIDRGRKEALLEFGLGETGQPSEFLTDEDTNTFVDFSGDHPPYYDLCCKIATLIRSNGFDTGSGLGTLSKSITSLVVKLRQLRPYDDLDLG